MPAVEADALIAEIVNTSVDFKVGKTTMTLPSPFTWPPVPDDPTAWLDVVLSKPDAAKFRRAVKAGFGVDSHLAGALFFRLYAKVLEAAAGLPAGE